MAQSKANVCQIFVKTLDGKTITLDVNITMDTISDIKHKILNFEGIQPEHQMLTYCGKKLESKHTANHYKLNAFDTIDLSLKLLSSPTTIAIKLPSDKPDIHIAFTPFTTLRDITHKLNHHPTEEIPRYFVLNDHILRDCTIRVAQIDEIWKDLTLHTTFSVPFQEASHAKFKFMHYSQCIMASKPIDITKERTCTRDTSIKDLVFRCLRQTNIDPLFYSGYCPFKHVIVTYHRTQVQLRLDESQENAEPLLPKQADEFGLLPETTLKMLTGFFSACDCCTPSGIDESAKHKHVVSSNTLPHETEHEQCVVIQVALPDDAFILRTQHHRFYYIDGIFYRKHDYQKAKRNNTVDLQLYPVMTSPQALNEELLVCGYIRRETQTSNQHIPTDVVQVIVLLYPALYGGQYDIAKHNTDLHNKLYQKTNVFVINKIGFYLKYGTQSEGDNEAAHYVPSDEDAYYLVLDFSKQQTISEMVLLCRVYCKTSQQSYTFIRNVSLFGLDAEDPLHYIELPEFGIGSSLSSMTCEIQIVNMLRFCEKVAHVYEYPVLLTQSAYLLEWKIDGDLFERFKQCVTDDYNQSFESPLFHDLFKLRCYPNEKKRLLLSIQLISLPMNRPDKENTSGLKTKCQVYETETCTNTAVFESVFDYTEDKSAAATMLMESDNFMQKKELQFRVKVVIMDPHDHNVSPLMRYLRDSVRRNVSSVSHLKF